MTFTKKNEEAVSPVIGVILMVAVTVILAAIIAAFVFNMAGSMQTTKTVGLVLQQNATGYGVVTIQGGPDLAALKGLSYTLDGGAETAMFTPTTLTVGKINTTVDIIQSKRVIIIGNFTDGSRQILIDKQF